MTTNTKTVVSPSKFQVGDEVTFWMDGFEPWQGGKGIVRNRPKDDSWDESFSHVEITEAPPANKSVKKGHSTYFKTEWLRPVKKAAGEDAVNHPAHYGGGDNPYEVIKVAEAWGLDKDAYLFNVLKYIARAGKKGSKLEDLKKGGFYINRRISLEEAK